MKKITFETIKSIFISTSVILLFVAAFAFYRLKIAPVISEGLRQDLSRYIKSISVICAACVIQQIVGTALSWYGRNVASRTKSELDDKLIPLLRKTVKIILWIVAFIIILPFYGVNINALIATLGVSSLAIALAAQDTIANMISGFLIMVDTPFRIDDRIKLPSGENARVLDIGVRRSTFLSEDKKTVITVPNVNLSKSKIVNYTYAEKMGGSS